MPNYFDREADRLYCSHCGEGTLDEDFIQWLNAVRHEFGKPMVVSSGYRCPKHPIEYRKSKPGAHSTGRAVDIRVMGEDVIELTAIAYKHGCRRVGWNQKGSARFVHLDRADMPNGSWSY